VLKAFAVSHLANASPMSTLRDHPMNWWLHSERATTIKVAVSDRNDAYRETTRTMEKQPAKVTMRREYTNTNCATFRQTSPHRSCCPSYDDATLKINCISLSLRGQQRSPRAKLSKTSV